MDDITVKEIFDYARINEQNARNFYLDAAKNARRENIKAFLKSLAKEEERHMERLAELEEQVEKGGRLPKPHGIVKPLGYEDYIGNVALDENADYQEVLKVAMAREKEAMESYRRYSGLVEDKKARELFTLLAEEESRHLRGFEEKFDDFMKEIENW